MAFGEAYQGMSEREIMIEIATKQDVLAQQMAGLAIRQEKLESKVDAIKCPSPRCQEHDRRLTTLETTEGNRKDSGTALIAWVGVLTAIVAVVVSVIALFGG